MKGLKRQLFKQVFQSTVGFYCHWPVVGDISFYYVSFSIAIIIFISKAMKPEPPALIRMTTKFFN